NPELYAEPKGNEPPPWWIRGILILTCTGVSFAHGSNDGQKGMGLIMLILIGTVPTAYALNRAMPESQVAVFQAVSTQAQAVVARQEGVRILGGNPREQVTDYVSQHRITGATYPALALLIEDISRQVGQYGAISRFPAEAVANARN